MAGAFLFLTVGFFVLSIGAELMVRGSTSIALKIGITPLVIGLTVVAFGTSSPELAVSVQSTLGGSSPLALGNVIGSNIANIGLVLGFMAIIRPVNIEQELVKKQIPLVIASSIFLWLLLLDGELGFVDGVFLCIGLLGFLVFSYRQAKGDAASCALIASNPIIGAPKKSTAFYVVLLITGITMLVYGSTMFVESAIELAQLMGVSQVIIGLSLVAIGTSIPELATSVVASIKGEQGLAVGGVVGSNLFNILGILGITALLDSIFGGELNLIDFGVMLAYAVILLPFAWTNLQISRKEGIALLAGYIAYMFYIYTSG